MLQYELGGKKRTIPADFYERLTRVSYLNNHEVTRQKSIEMS